MVFELCQWLFFVRLSVVARPHSDRVGATDSVDKVEFDQQQTDWYVTSFFNWVLHRCPYKYFFISKLINCIMGELNE